MAQPARDKANRPRWPFDLFRYVFAPRRYKPLPPPNTHYDDEPRVLWAINRKWLSHVIGTVDLLAQDDAWQGDDDARYLATQEAERMMTQNLPLISPDLLKFKRTNSGSSWRLLVSFDGEASWNDTDYTFIGNAVRETAIHPDVTEVNTSEVLGSVEAVDTPAAPNAERIFRTYLIHLDKSKLERGDTGANGKGIFFVDPPSAVTDPNQPPEIAIVGETDDGQFVQAALPRPPTWTVGDVLPLPPGSVPTFEISETEIGDLIIDVGMVTGATGENGSGIDIDEDAPEIGEFKDYDALVPPKGFVVPVVLKENDVITISEQAKGKWTAENELSTDEYVSDENGITVGLVEDVGRLMHVIKRPTSSLFGDEAFYSDSLSIDTDDTEVAFRQAKRVGFLPGGGYLKLRYTIYRPNLDFHIIGLHDFRPNDGGWHIVDAPESSDVNYGGFYAPGDGTNGGYKPTYNAAAGMFSLSIAPPLGAPLVRIDTVRMYWEDADGHFAWVVKSSHGGGWGYSSVHNLSGSFGDDLIDVTTSCEKIVIHCNSYGQDGTTWRLYQLQITGAES